MTKKFLFAMFSICLGLTTVFGQPNEAAIAAQRAQIKNLEQIVGQWQGTGWIEQGATKYNFAGSENVQKKIDGLALLVEGKFKTKFARNSEEKTIHETLAVISFDAKSQKYDFHTFLANGMSGKHELKPTASGLLWGFDFLNGGIRYLIKITGDVWFETGEISTDDGKTWKKFFEMELRKVK
ncbi:MAG TPA: hypothetical protein VF692_03905 [Pyrinomonadaceae bacterium]|jgi:hypothetical protein